MLNFLSIGYPLIGLSANYFNELLHQGLMGIHHLVYLLTDDENDIQQQSKATRIQNGFEVQLVLVLMSKVVSRRNLTG